MCRPCTNGIVVYLRVETACSTFRGADWRPLFPRNAPANLEGFFSVLGAAFAAIEALSAAVPLAAAALERLFDRTPRNRLQVVIVCTEEIYLRDMPMII